MEDRKTPLKVFQKYDIESKSYITLKQFISLIRDLEFTQLSSYKNNYKKVARVFLLFNKNSNGKLDFDEFYDWWNNENKFSLFTGKKAKLLKKAFSLYTTHVEGKKMTISEFENLMEDLDISHTDIDFDAIDKDHDGLISFYEFCSWLNWF